MRVYELQGIKGGHGGSFVSFGTVKSIPGGGQYIFPNRGIHFGSQ